MTVPAQRLHNGSGTQHAGGQLQLFTNAAIRTSNYAVLLRGWPA